MSAASGVRSSRWLDRGEVAAVAAAAARVGPLGEVLARSPIRFVGAALPGAGRVGEAHALAEKGGQLVVLGRLRGCCRTR